MTSTSTPGSIYRKKPVTIRAVQWRDDMTAAEAHGIYQWIEQGTLGSFEPLAVLERRAPCPASGVSIDPTDGRLMIATLEGIMYVNLGDWVIRGVAGEFYPCKSDIFEATYEMVDDDERTDSVSEVRGDEAS